MKLSSKARYAVLALVDLSLNSKKVGDTKKPVSLFDIAERQNLSQKYLEQLFSKLRKNNIVQSTRGQNGGYLLAEEPHTFSISHIIDAVDEPIKSTHCDPSSSLGCQGKGARCLSHDLWRGMEKVMRNYLASITLEDVVRQRPMPLSIMTNPINFTDRPDEDSHVA